MVTVVGDASGGHAATRESSGRMVGIDVARAVAFGGMLLAHYTFAPPASPDWLQAVDAAADGRAAPLFCVLAGVGAGLLSARGRDREVVGRGLVLVAVGCLVWPYVQAIALVLPHYGALLVAVPLLRRAADHGATAERPGRLPRTHGRRSLYRRRSAAQPASA